ncbi:MAG: LytTR family transcriptional regulator, partial [Rhodobacteraceae bacterium]|nr:LytTR family transcriptional regulator [Paracoccaceae bacterium]
MIEALGFSAAWVLVALAVLPALWWLLRVVPPQPKRVYFPALIFLLGLNDKENDSAKTPWWLLMLRLMAAGFLILALSGPVVNPPPSEGGETPQAPLVILRDGGWASALDWFAEQKAIEANLRSTIREGRTSVVISLTEQPQASLEALLTSGDDQITRLSAMRPAPFAPDYAAWSDWFAGQSIHFDGLW